MSFTEVVTFGGHTWPRQYVQQIAFGRPPNKQDNIFKGLQTSKAHLQTRSAAAELVKGQHFSENPWANYSTYSRLVTVRKKK